MANPKPIVLVGTLDEPHENSAGEIEVAIHGDRTWWLHCDKETGPQLRKLQGRKVSITVAIEPT